MDYKIIYTKPGDDSFYLFEQVMEICYTPAQAKQVQAAVSPACFATGIVLLVGGKPVARCAVYNNPFLIYDGRHAWCIGNYACIANNGAALQLLEAAYAFIRENGGSYVIGPMNGSTWDNYRFAQDDSDLFFTESYNHAYYNAQWMQCGFKPIAGYFSGIDTALAFNNPEVIKLERQFAGAGITIRRMCINRYAFELRKAYPFITEAFKTNFLYTPIDEAGFLAKYLPLQNLLDERFVLVAENAAGETVGIFMALHNRYCTAQKQLVIKTIARKNDAALRGLGHVIGNQLYKNAAEAGYDAIIHAFMFNHGTSVKISENYSGQHFKTYTLYGKTI